MDYGAEPIKLEPLEREPVDMRFVYFGECHQSNALKRALNYPDISRRPFDDRRSASKSVPLEAEPKAETRTVPPSAVIGITIPSTTVAGIPPATPAPTPTPTPTSTPTPAPRLCRCACCGSYGSGQCGRADGHADRRSHGADAPEGRYGPGRDRSRRQLSGRKTLHHHHLAHPFVESTGSRPRRVAA